MIDRSHSAVNCISLLFIHLTLSHLKQILSFPRHVYYRSTKQYWVQCHFIHRHLVQVISHPVQTLANWARNGRFWEAKLMMLNEMFWVLEHKKNLTSCI